MPKRPPLSYTTTRLTLGTFLRIMFRPRYLDRDKIPVDGPLIIAANHLSHIDPAFIMTAVKRPVSYLSKGRCDWLCYSVYTRTAWINSFIRDFSSISSSF